MTIKKIFFTPISKNRKDNETDSFWLSYTDPDPVFGSAPPDPIFCLLIDRWWCGKIVEEINGKTNLLCFITTHVLCYCCIRLFMRHPGPPGGGRRPLKLSGGLGSDPSCLILTFGRRRPPGSGRKNNAALAVRICYLTLEICGFKLDLLWAARGWPPVPETVRGAR